MRNNQYFQTKKMKTPFMIVIVIISNPQVSTGLLTNLVIQLKLQKIMMDLGWLDRGDLQPKIFHTIRREQVEFNDFDGNQECASRFLKNLCSFEKSNLQDSLFQAILYGQVECTSRFKTNLCSFEECNLQDSFFRLFYIVCS